MSAYSKEPWEVRNEHIAEHVESKPFCCDIGAIGRGNFAYVQAYPEDSKWGTSNEEAKANALLIAAAPELLEALAACEAALTAEGGWTSTIKLARAAIAKAKGETP